ncbi:response regulator receiver domain protein [Synechococcus sp. PCC 7335]|uniref:response regulator n=1 Tax=Synechococcus sp. (strain ATCC 29403 / PCC 7335) TaxID=91464 RepID=UPI00017EB88B|nr:response regulator [Synechococcus sp. PCC 7335]EDX84955.1 response regulator receiver domain protein [Synechococcus sp. PCC 7335]
MRILLVEDDESVAKILHKVLTDEHYIVDVAYTGHIGWQLVSSFNYDLIILDVLLPELDGIKFCQQLRAQEYTLPVLFVTALDDSSEKIAGLNAGADDYITKPFELEELLARVRALLRRGKTSVVLTTLEWEGLRLEVNSRELTYRNNKLSLTPKEHAMLELFLRNPAQAFSREAIIDNLWSYSDAPGEETVTSHMKGLRRKLRTVGAPADLIETVYGVGYRLKPIETEVKPIETEELCSVDSRSATSDIVKLRHQHTQAALSALWKSVKSQQTNRLAILQQAFEQLQRGTLSKEMRESAYRSSHSLTGVLGIFGLETGSEIARQIQILLQGETPILADDQARLDALIRALQATIDEAIEHRGRTAVEIPKVPLLVLVDPQLRMMPALVGMLRTEGFTVKISHHIESLVAMLSSSRLLDKKAGINQTDRTNQTDSRTRSERTVPDVVLLGFSFADFEDDCESDLNDDLDRDLRSSQLDRLAKLVNEVPSLMLLICSGDGSLSSRVRAAQLGDYPFFYNPDVASVAKTIALLRSHPLSAPRKILAVDDDSQLLQTLKTRLALENYQIVTLDKPLEFWKTLQDENPDLLLLDISMPQFTGIELCQTVRRSPAWRHLPIVFFTAHAEPHLQQAAFKAGGDNLIEKSLSDAQLLAHLEHQMKRSYLQQVIATANSPTTVPP